MDTTILVALIALVGTLLTAGATVFAAALARRQHQPPENGQPARQDAAQPPATTPNELETRLRADPRIKRLLANKNWRDAADAAIGFFCRGTKCSIDSWIKSSTWQQVEAVYRAITGQQLAGVAPANGSVNPPVASNGLPVAKLANDNNEPEPIAEETGRENKDQETWTFLFITKRDYAPERLENGQEVWWSCGKNTRCSDSIWVYVTGEGICYCWQATSDAERNEEWKYVCDVVFQSKVTPPITIQEIRNAISREEWGAPFVNFRGFRTLTIPASVIPKLAALRKNVVAKSK